MSSNQLRIGVIRTENRHTGTGRTLRTLRTLSTSRTLRPNLRVHNLHHVHNQRRSVNRYAVSDTMLKNNVDVRHPVDEFEIVAGLDCQQEIPCCNLILVLRDHQFRCRISNRRTILRQPDIDLKTVAATTTMMQLRRKLQIICARIGERDPRVRNNTDAVRLSCVVQRHRSRSIDRCGLLILIGEKRPVISERSGSTRSNNSHLIRQLLNNNRIRRILDNNRVDGLIDNHHIRFIVGVNTHRVTSGRTLNVPCKSLVTTPLLATISKSYT
jgi:hypothetical protein